MDIELVTEGLRFPEGPIAMADGSVILTEIEGQALTRVLPDGRKETVSETGGGPNGAAIGPDGAIYVTNNGGSFEFMKTNGLNIPGPTPPGHQGGYIQRVDIKTGKAETIYAPDSCPGGSTGRTTWSSTGRAACGSPTTAAATRTGASGVGSTTPSSTAHRSPASANT